MGDKAGGPSEHPTNVNDVDEWYTRKYAQLCAEAHSKHISDKPLSGKGWDSGMHRNTRLSNELICFELVPEAVRCLLQRTWQTESSL